MQLLCYEGTCKETKQQAIKSKGVVQVFRMFCLDGYLPKDCSARQGGVTFIQELRQETTWGGVTSLIVTSGGTYEVLAGNWLPPSCNPGGTPGIVQAVC